MGSSSERDIMKRIIYIFTLFFCFSQLGFSEGYSAKKYYLHSLVEQNLNDNSRKAIMHWVDFLYESNDSLRANYWDKSEKLELKEDYCLFEKLLLQMPRETLLQYFPPYILSAEKIGNEYFLKTVFAQKEVSLNDTSANNQNPVAIIDIVVSNQSGKFYLKNSLNYQVLNFKKAKIGKIEYYVHPLLEIDNFSCQKANEFCDSLSKIWTGQSLQENIKYYVTPSPESLSRLLGFDFAYFGYTFGYTSINAKYIFSGTGNFNYRHELAHLVIGDIKNSLLSEGLATYYGGSGNVQFVELVKDFNKENYPLNEDKLKSILQNTNSKNYYVLGAILVNEVIKKSGIEGLKKFSQININDEKMISEICKNLGIKNLIDFINKQRD